MIFIAILEDHSDDKERLVSLLHQYFSSSQEEYSFDSFVSAEEFKAKSKIKYDLYFLDIEMATISGFDLAKEIRNHDEKAILIFTTNLTSYIQKAYEVSPLTYLLKPIKEKELIKAMDEAKKVLESRKKKGFLVKTAEVLIPLHYEDLLYIESQGHDIVYHTLDKEYHEWSSLNKMEEKLKNHGFSRIKSSLLVNLKYITKVSFDKIEMGKIILPVGRSYRSSFLRDMNLWMNR